MTAYKVLEKLDKLELKTSKFAICGQSVVTDRINFTFRFALRSGRDPDAFVALMSATLDEFNEKAMRILKLKHPDFKTELEPHKLKSIRSILLQEARFAATLTGPFLGLVFDEDEKHNKLGLMPAYYVSFEVMLDSSVDRKTLHFTYRSRRNEQFNTVKRSSPMSSVTMLTAVWKIPDITDRRLRDQNARKHKR